MADYPFSWAPGTLPSYYGPVGTETTQPQQTVSDADGKPFDPVTILPNGMALTQSQAQANAASSRHIADLMMGFSGGVGGAGKAIAEGRSLVPATSGALGAAAPSWAPSAAVAPLEGSRVRISGGAWHGEPGWVTSIQRHPQGDMVANVHFDDPYQGQGQFKLSSLQVDPSQWLADSAAARAAKPSSAPQNSSGIVPEFLQRALFKLLGSK